MLSGEFIGGQVSAQNAAVMASEVMSATVTTGQTVAELIEAHRGDPAFAEMRREYGDTDVQAARDRAMTDWDALRDEPGAATFGAEDPLHPNPVTFNNKQN